MKPSISILLLAGCLFYTARPAVSGAFGIFPLRVDLTEAVPSTLVTVKNNSPEPLRMQVTCASWDEDANGKMQLAPTGDIVAFPLALTLQPGESRNVRVGRQTRASTTERTYRVFCQELPPIRKKGEKPGIRVLTRMGVPVFVPPASPRREVKLVDATLASGVLSFRIQNTGNVSYLVKNFHVRGLSSSFSAVFDQNVTGWYVLAGHTRSFKVAAQPNVAAHLSALDVEVLSAYKPVRGTLTVRRQ
jgi:fimbrial chaperone protein